MARHSRAFPACLLAVLVSALVVGCSPARERPLRGAQPGAEHPTATPALPPTLTSAADLRFRALPSPSPGLAPSPAASPVAVASPNPAPPIVRTIQPAANGQAPLGAAVTVSATLVGRGADLAAATLVLDGADTGAQIEKANPRQWTIHAVSSLGAGLHTARVHVTDATGAVGGFTWQFRIGAPPPTATPEPEPEPHAEAEPTAQPAQTPRADATPAAE